MNSNFPHPNTPKSQESSREQTINYAATHENGNDLLSQTQRFHNAVKESLYNN